MLLLLENGPMSSGNLTVCLCTLRGFHWLKRNLVDTGFFPSVGQDVDVPDHNNE